MFLLFGSNIVVNWDLCAVDAKQAQGFLSFFKKLPTVSDSSTFFLFFFGFLVWSRIVLFFLGENGWLYISFSYLQDPRAIRFFDRKVSAPSTPSASVPFML